MGFHGFRHVLAGAGEEAGTLLFLPPPLLESLLVTEAASEASLVCLEQNSALAHQLPPQRSVVSLTVVSVLCTLPLCQNQSRGRSALQKPMVSVCGSSSDFTLWCKSCPEHTFSEHTRRVDSFSQDLH